MFSLKSSPLTFLNSGLAAAYRRQKSRSESSVGSKRLALIFFLAAVFTLTWFISPLFSVSGQLHSAYFGHVAVVESMEIENDLSAQVAMLQPCYVSQDFLAIAC